LKAGEVGRKEGWGNSPGSEKEEGLNPSLTNEKANVTNDSIAQTQSTGTDTPITGHAHPKRQRGNDGREAEFVKTATGLIHISGT
jgi:hypothetical protein